MVCAKNRPNQEYYRITRTKLGYKREMILIKLLLLQLFHTFWKTQLEMFQKWKLNVQVYIEISLQIISHQQFKKAVFRSGLEIAKQRQSIHLNSWPYVVTRLCSQKLDRLTNHNASFYLTVLTFFWSSFKAFSFSFIYFLHVCKMFRNISKVMNI